MSEVTNIPPRQVELADGAAEVDRLVIKGLRAPLSAPEAARLDALTAGSEAFAAQADRLVRTWTIAGALIPERIFGRHDVTSTTRRWLVAGGLAVAAAVPFAVWLETRPPAQTLYEAPNDGPSHITLADGSRIVLSRGGRMTARLTHDRRDIRLIAGEAFYTVARDLRRPFQVTVGDHLLTVLGTAFNVDPSATGLRVDLVEGSLRVQRLGSRADSVVMTPGERYWAGRMPLVAAADVDAATAWANGRLVFDNAPLSEVARELARQTGRTLKFAEPSLASLRFSGVLRLDQSQDWQAGLQAVLPIRLSQTPDGYFVRHS